jgi:hypothetical protein
MIRDLRREREQSEGFPSVVFFVQGSPEQSEGFFRRRWPGASVVSDPDRVFFTAFRRRRGRFGELLGPAVWASAVRAALKGHGIGKPVGDPRILPGVFLVRGERILWEQDFHHIGRRPDYGALLVAALEGGPG